MYHSVMIIDDSSVECFLAKTIIRNSKFAEEVTTYDSAVSALAYLQNLGNDPSKFPDVLLVDIQMPVMNGFDFIDKFLEFPFEIQTHCRIIMFSSSIASEDHARIAQYPSIRKFLSKPLSEKMFHDLSL